MSKISIVMPIYNAAEFLTESIDDIRKQTFTDWELICVNDGSTDNCGQILANFEKNDNRIKVITQENYGGGAARNAGLNVAQGKYVIFLDADDRFEETLLQNVFENAEANQSDIVIFGADCFDYSSGKVRAATWLLDEQYLTESYVVDNCLNSQKKPEIIYEITNGTVWNKLFRRDFIKSNELKFQEVYSADCMLFVVMALALADKISVLNKVLVHYRENVPTGQIANVCKNPLGALDVSIAIRDCMIINGLFPVYENAYINCIVKFVINRLNRMGIGIAQQTLYNNLHNDGLKKIGINQSNLEIIKDDNIRIECKKILSIQYEDYIFDLCNLMKNMINPKGSIYCLPEQCPKNVKIALYGAGNVGKSYFAYLLNSSEHRLVGWFDKMHEKCGYPVENPEKLLDRDFDIVIIAVEMKTAAASIQNDLIKLGVEESKIFWAEPILL